MKRILLYTVLGMLLLLPVTMAQEEHSMESMKTEVNNSICPISGEPVDSMGEPFIHHYEGKAYKLCCQMCQKDFEKDPQKYSRLAEEKGALKKTEAISHESMQQMSQAEKKTMKEGAISHYTCGMHPQIKVTSENYEKGDTKCPICAMPLVPVKVESTSDEAFNENVISRVSIKARELKLAGVKTAPVKKRKLYKEIRAVGRVAYDPQLTIAQDEFVSAVKALKKAKQSQIPEIAERAEATIESSKRKLFLLGLNQDQIKELEANLKVQENLILPGDKMWIYGDVFEYELNWVKAGAIVKVRPISLEGEEFYGEVVSINPVIDPMTRSVRFRALVDNPKQKLKPEMYVDIEMFSQYETPDGKEEVLSIPKDALLDTGRRKIVWVAKGKEDFEGRSVKSGPEAVTLEGQAGRFYPVLEGLQEGESVVTKGGFLIDSQSQITGVIASSYGGALEATDQKGSQGHNH